MQTLGHAFQPTKSPYGAANCQTRPSFLAFCQRISYSVPARLTKSADCGDYLNGPGVPPKHYGKHAQPHDGGRNSQHDNARFRPGFEPGGNGNFVDFSLAHGQLLAQSKLRDLRRVNGFALRGLHILSRRDESARQRRAARGRPLRNLLADCGQLHAICAWPFARRHWLVGMSFYWFGAWPSREFSCAR